MTSVSDTARVLTIVTATWNRRHLLPRLYESLRAQKNYFDAFEWLVVDDGSTDGTLTYITELSAQAPFSIRVLSRENGGKHRALNVAVAHVRTPWLLVVDSDDRLLRGGIAQALEDICSNEADPAVTAIIAPLDFGTVGAKVLDLPDHTFNYACWIQFPLGDTSILMRAKVLRSFPFPEYPDENFVAESSVYARAFRDGGIRLSNRKLVAAEYQAEGLSARSLELRCRNPLGCLFTYNAHLEARLASRENLSAQANFHRFFWHALHGKRSPHQAGFRARPLWLLFAAPMFLRDLLKTRWPRA